MHRIAVLLLFAASLPAGSITPAGKAIQDAQAAIAREPANPEHHNALALAFTRRARETSDPGFYRKADTEIATSLELSPGNLVARKLKAWVLLGKHEFAEALRLATELRKETGDDPMVYGLLADANAELGNYQAAEEAAQWMLNVGRSSVPGLTRAAYLREIFGDIEGALDLMGQVFNRLDPNETEDRAWTLSQMGHLLTVAGKYDAGIRAFAEALRLAPEYHYALAGMAKVRSVEGKYEEALVLLRRRAEIAPHPENLFDLGVALQRAGRLADAKVTFREFERKALAESRNWDNANRELVKYYCDFVARPEEALRIASLEVARRRDVMTLDAFAWALYKNGRSREALAQAEAAVAPGTVDASVLYHAGAIAFAADHREFAGKYLRRGLEVNGRSELAEETRRLLQRIDTAQPPRGAPKARVRGSAASTRGSVARTAYR